MRRLVRREAPMTVSRLFEDLDGYIVGIFAVALIASFIAMVSVAVVFSTHNTAASNRIIAAKDVSSFGIKASHHSYAANLLRKQQAQHFLKVNQEETRLGGESLYNQLELAKSDIKSIKTTSITGKVAKIDTQRWAYGTYFLNVYWWPGAPFWWLCLGLAFMIFYAYDLYERTGYRRYAYALADLNWKRPSTWILATVLGPGAWIIFAISAIRMPSCHEETQVAEPVVSDEANDTPTEQTEAGAGEERYSGLETYTSASQSAFKLYEQFRSDAGRRRRDNRLSEIQRLLSRMRGQASELADSLKSTQRQIGQLQVEQKRLEETSVPPIDDPRVIAEEFETIKHLPGVIAVQVVNNRIRVICRARIEYDGDLYDVGDFALDFDWDNFRVQDLRSGVKAGWYKGDYPDYRYRDGGFCFGPRRDEIHAHISKQQYVEAIALAVDCLMSVNSDDQSKIPRAFKKVTEH